MVHRDIKPANLLIPHAESEASTDILVKILDFGLARLQGKTQGDTIALRGEAGVLGTPDYISPEQSRTSTPPIFAPTSTVSAAFYSRWPGACPSLANMPWRSSSST